MTKYKVRETTLADFRPAVVNPNAGSERGQGSIEKSIEQYGAGRSGLAANDGQMIGGSHAYEAMAATGIEDVIVVETDGKAWVIVQRTDLDTMDNPTARGLQIADNRTTELGYVPDDSVLAALLTTIGEQDKALLQGTGFSVGEIDALLDPLAGLSADPVDLPAQYAILIDCTSEQEQADLLERFTSEGLSCRALIS